MSEPTWLTADLGAAADLSPRSRADRMRHSPQNVHSKEEDGKDLHAVAQSVSLSRSRKSVCVCVCVLRLNQGHSAFWV